MKDINRVKYYDSYPTDRSPVDSVSAYIGRLSGKRADAWMRTLFFSKSIEWSYEKEWRVLASAKFKESGGVLKLPAKSFHAIYIGCRATGSNEKEIIDKARAVNPDVNIYKNTIATNAFKLEFSPVD